MSDFLSVNGLNGVNGLPIRESTRILGEKTMKLFTQHDVANSICTHEEVGQPWQDRYSIDDHFKRLCTIDQVGSPKPIVLSEVEDLEDAIDEAPSTDWIKSAFQGMGGRQAFVEFCKKNPAQMWPLLLKGGLTQFLKEDQPLKSAEDLTDEDIKNMSTSDLKRIALSAMGITKKPDLLNAMGVTKKH